MDKYYEWVLEESFKSEKELLMTLNELRKERKDNGEDMLDDEQADKMKDCWVALCKIYHVRTMLHEAKTKGMNFTKSVVPTM